VRGRGGTGRRLRRLKPAATGGGFIGMRIH
jgi:hypothetical protein